MSVSLLMNEFFVSRDNLVKYLKQLPCLRYGSETVFYLESEILLRCLRTLLSDSNPSRLTLSGC